MKVFDKTWKLAVAGALVGVLAALLAYFGNPANMAICIACFVRDTAGNFTQQHRFSISVRRL